MYVLVTKLRVPPMNLCIGVSTRFRLDPPVETLGHSLRFYVLVEYMNLRLCDAYRIIIPTDTVTPKFLFGFFKILFDLREVI